MKIQLNSSLLEDPSITGLKGVFLIFYRRDYRDFQASGDVSGGAPGLGNGREGAEPTKVVILEKDKMDPALEFMATVQAYFQGMHLMLSVSPAIWFTCFSVASKRFVDNVSMVIEYELVRGDEQDIFHLLWTRLGLGSLDGQKLCEEEVKQVASKWDELNQKLDRLAEALIHARVLQNSAPLT